MNKLKNSKCSQDDFDKESFEIREILSSLGKGGPVEIKAGPASSGPKVSSEDIERWDEAARKQKKLRDNVD